MNLKRRIQRLQRELGVKDDGIVGPRTVAKMEAALLPARLGDGDVPRDGIDKRSAENLATLIERAHEPFERFMRLAKATAATLGCDYVAIGGTRSWEDQDKLYAQGRTTTGRIVTKVRGGRSWHNFGLAVDFGVFKDGAYLDNADPKLARRVHIACSKHAAECGLKWGGSWSNFKDIPHYQLAVDVNLAQARNLYKEGKWA